MRIALPYYDNSGGGTTARAFAGEACRGGIKSNPGACLKMPVDPLFDMGSGLAFEHRHFPKNTWLPCGLKGRRCVHYRAII